MHACLFSPIVEVVVTQRDWLGPRKGKAQSGTAPWRGTPGEYAGVREDRELKLASFGAGPLAAPSQDLGTCRLHNKPEGRMLLADRR